MMSYLVEFLVLEPCLSAVALRQWLTKSLPWTRELAVAGGSCTLKVHVRTSRPALALAAGAACGRLRDVLVEPEAAITSRESDGADDCKAPSDALLERARSVNASNFYDRLWQMLQPGLEAALRERHRITTPLPKLRTTLVVSSAGDRRRDWSDEFERTGVHVASCSARACPLLSGGTCHLLSAADAAVYDEDTLQPELFLGLVRAPSRPTILFARDEVADGRHQPKFTRILDHRGAATIFPHLR